MSGGSNRGLGCVILLALPFAAVGLLVGLQAARILWQWVEIREWHERPARILHAELVSHVGDDAVTYEVVARYEYEFEGVIYQGERVGLSSGADNVGSYHQDRYRELADHQASGRPFRCFVDPDEPGSAVLYRGLRWGLLSLLGVFALMFGGVGFGLLALVAWGKRKLAEEQRLVAGFPEEPWRWKSEWSEGRIRASGRAQFLMPCLMASLWNLVSWPLLLTMRDEILDEENRLALLALVFPLVGVGLIVWAVRAWVRWRKFGDSVFEMSTFPGVVGGRLAGRVLTSVDLQPTGGFRLTLSCVNRVRSGSGDNRSTQEHLLWQEVRRIAREPFDYDPGRAQIPVLFAIPYDCPPTEKRGSDDEILWRLEVNAELPGVDYAAGFEIPIFRTAESRADFHLDDASRGGQQAVTAPPAELADYGIRSELLPSGARRLTIAAARHKGPATLVTGFLVLWLGINLLLAHLEAPLVFPIVWGLFSLLLLYGALDLWFERRTIEVHPDRLVLSGGLFGLGRKRTIPRDTIEEIQPVRGLQAGNRLFYRLRVGTRDGKNYVAATKLDDLSVARRVIDELWPDGPFR